MAPHLQTDNHPARPDTTPTQPERADSNPSTKPRIPAEPQELSNQILAETTSSSPTQASSPSYLQDGKSIESDTFAAQAYRSADLPPTDQAHTGPNQLTKSHRDSAAKTKKTPITEYILGNWNLITSSAKCRSFFMTVLFFITLLTLIAACYQAFAIPTPTSVDRKQLETQNKSLEMQKAMLADQDIALEVAKQQLELEKWNTFNAYVRTCLDYAGKNVTSSRCQSAIAAFDRPPPYLPRIPLSDIQSRHLQTISTEKFYPIDPHTLAEPGIRGIEYSNLLSGLSVTAAFLLFAYIAHAFSWSISSVRFAVVWGKKKAKIEDDGLPSSFVDGQNEGAFSNAVQATNWRNPAISSESVVKHRRHTTQQLNRSDIWTAAYEGDIGAIQTHLESEKRPEINELHSHYGSVLHAAASSGKHKAVTMILKEKPDINIQGGRFHTAVQAAAYSGNRKIVKTLLEHGAKVGVFGGFCGSELHAAAEKGSADMVQLLVEHGADPRAKGGAYSYPLQAAVFKGDLKMVQFLIDHKADVNVRGGQYDTALHAGTLEGHTKAVEILLKHGADVNAPSEIYGRPLQIACRLGYEELGKLLVSYNADPVIQDQQLRTPLHDVARFGHASLAEALLDRGVPINAPDADQWTALHHAAGYGHENVLSLLIARGADVAATDKFSAPALFRAAELQHNTCVRLLLEAGTSVNARDTYGKTPLHGASPDEDIESQRLLLEHGADVNVRGDKGTTPLHEAASRGLIHSVRLLLAWNARSDLQDNDQATPLVATIQEGHDDVAELLLEQSDVDVNARNGSALQEAIARGKTRLIKLMLYKNASLQVQGSRYGGVVQAAVYNEGTEILEMLLELRANVNIQGGEYGTALQAAAFKGHLDAVRMLLEHGAIVDAKGGRYGCAYAAAHKSSAPEQVKQKIIQLLEQYGATFVPAKAHEFDRWVLTPSGWTWLRENTL